VVLKRGWQDQRGSTKGRLCRKLKIPSSNHHVKEECGKGEGNGAQRADLREASARKKDVRDEETPRTLEKRKRKKKSQAPRKKRI